MRAEQLEHVARKPPEAADAYATIAKDAADADLAARAISAQARCLVRAGRRAEAIDLLADTLGGERFARAADADGRLIAADAELRALELIDDPSDRRYQRVAGRLAHRLVDYSPFSLGSAQRRFLLNALAGKAGFQSAPNDADSPSALQDGEELAAAVLESGRC